MSEPNLTYDPLLSEIYQALRSCEPAIASLHAARDFLSDADARRCDELAGRIAAERIFEPRDRGVFEAVLSAISAQLEDMTVMRVDFRDVGEPDWDREYTVQGFKLFQHHRTILALKSHLDRIAALRRAEVLALRFRTADAG